MASKAALIVKIESKVKRYYVMWAIGVTDNPNRRRGEHGNPAVWYHWDADTEQIARDVEAYFVAKGMKGDTEGGGSADYVYILM